jgi:hypothetical protein
MKQLFFHIILFCLALILLNSCSKPKNEKNATLIEKDGHLFLKLTGKRIPLKHDPASIYSNELVNDSIFISIPEWKDGIIKGKDIPVEKGYYKYQGYISINTDTVKVNLVIINTDDDKTVPETWNGIYYLGKR